MADVKKNAPAVQSGAAQVTTATVPTAPKKRKKVADPNESKADKFRRLANVRVNKTLKIMGYIAALGNKSNYDYTPEQAEKILVAIGDGVGRLVSAFSGKKKEENGFQL